MRAIITTFLLAMVPVCELRGAIPIGVAQGISPIHALIICIIANMVPVPFIILFIRTILNKIRVKSEKLDALITRFEKKMEKKADRVLKYEKFGLFIFVAIPFPGTGAWTGAFIASLLNMRLKEAVPMILLGVVTAGVIVTLITVGVINL